MIGRRVESEEGVVLISTFIVLIALTAITVGFLYMVSIQTKGAGWDLPSSQALWLADAGVQKAIWYLKTPTGSGGQGENWTTAGTTENLGSGSYTMVVARYDFALSANGASASATSSASGTTPGNAIDGNDATYWESNAAPSGSNPQDLIITFPYALTLNKVRFLSPSSGATARNYTWGVSSNNVTYTTVVTVTGNAATDVTNTFSAQTGVNYLRLRVTQDGTGSPSRVRIATLEAIASKITSTGTAGSLSRKVQQTVVADDGSPQNQVAYDQVDWNETVP